MSPDIRCPGSVETYSQYHFCVPERRSCSGRSIRPRNCLELWIMWRWTLKIIVDTSYRSHYTSAQLSFLSLFLPSSLETRSLFTNR